MNPDLTIENSAHDDQIDNPVETSYGVAPRALNAIETQSAPVVVPKSSDICVDLCCDKLWPPCCDRIGALDCKDVPDHELCDLGVTWCRRLQFCMFFEWGKISLLCSWFCTPFNRTFGWSKIADLTVPPIYYLYILRFEHVREVRNITRFGPQ
jgi:hypothetical protein